MKTILCTLLMAIFAYSSMGQPIQTLSMFTDVDANGNSIYASTLGAGVLKSTDSGETWFSASTGIEGKDIRSLAISPSNPNELVAAVWNQCCPVGGFLGVYKSTDAGSSWFSTSSGLYGDLGPIAYDPSNTNTIYVAGYFGSFFKTTDGGTNWIAVSGVFGDINALYVQSNGTVLAGGWGGVSKSTDGGLNWQNLSGVPPGNVYNIESIAADLNTIYLAVNTSGENQIYKTTDGGSNWLQIGQSIGGGNLLALINNPNTLFVGNKEGCYQTTDGGSSWSVIDTSSALLASRGSVANNNLILISSSGVIDIQGVIISTFAFSLEVQDSWNMVSIPGLQPTDQNVNTWWAYRDQGANVFRYAGGYQSVTDATPGIGYWMKHSGALTYNTGEEWPASGIQIVAHNPLVGASGWNLIGGYELSVATAGVTTNPPGLQSGPIYKYAAGYQVATTLDPGYGYWMKLSAAGQIIIPEALAKGTEEVNYFPEDWGKIILTDATGISYTLYAVNGEVNLDDYELPPAPMAGMFDIRFSSGRIAEDLNSAVKSIEMNGVTYPLTVRVEGMDIRLMDETGKTVNVNLKSGEDVVISDAAIQKLMVSGEMIPAEYALEQNYPNPFNPSTVIEFSLPEDVANVKLSIYNALGEKVVELVNTSLKVGRYQYQWNASGVATGIYIYELRTDKFNSVKKMILLK